jgi:acetoin utilization deacetylase AcuC-like enzyme
MVVTAEGFRRMARYVTELADQFAGGRLAVLHEGGYSQSYAPFCALAIVEELCGVRTPLGNLNDQARFDRMRPSREVGLDVDRALREIVEFQSRYWRLGATAGVV